MIQAWIQSQNFVPAFITCPANILKHHILYIAGIESPPASKELEACVPGLLPTLSIIPTNFIIKAFIRFPYNTT